MQKSNINYHRIFSDILEIKYPQKKKDCLPLLQKNTLGAIDILKIHEKLFGSCTHDRHHISYSKSDILKILDYQKKNHINNSQLANHFKISRNSIIKWKKIFLT